MNVTEPIINAALLGTATKEFTPVAFPASLEETFQKIQEKAEDTEAAFYQMAALTFAYHRAGLEASSDESINLIKEAPEDERPFFHREAGELLHSLYINRNKYLLLYAYRKAAQCNKLIPALYLQSLLTHAFDRNNPDRHQQQAFLAQLTGKRGRWLLPHIGLPDWGDSGNETWETASHEERKRMLRRLRKEHQAEGLALLQTELKNESATHRDDLIQCLRTGLNKADESFLLGIAATDRSSNVKETARRLLCSLPDSELVKTYCDLLRGKLHHNLLLGWSYDNLEFTPEMKKLGLEEVSPNKKEKDDQYLLRQLAERVPLSFWVEFYDCSPEKAATKLAKKPPFASYYTLWQPITNFSDPLWAYQTLKENPDESNVTALIGLLTAAQREDIAFQPEHKDAYIPDNWFNEDEESWGINFSSRTLQRMLHSSHYYYSKDMAERLALYFPASMTPKIEKHIQTKEPDHPIAKFCRIILECMSLKEKTNTLFNENQ